MNEQFSVSHIEAAVIAVALLLAMVWIPVLLIPIRLMRFSGRSLLRLAAAAFLLIAAMSSVSLFDAAIVALNQTGGVTRVMIDLGWIVKFAPYAIAALIAWVLVSRRR